MTIKEEITVECFLERVENFMNKYNKLRKQKTENYLTFESIAYDLIHELEHDIKNN